jgi:predicted nucleic acid-binding protein
MAGSFFDSNVALYAASLDLEKRSRAQALLAEGGTVSVQVLNEIANVGRRKMQLTWGEVRAFLRTFRELVTIVPITVETHDRGLSLAERYGFSVYDGLIAAAALGSGCDTLWSEDMHAGLVVDGVLRIVNPFAA